MPPSGGSGIMAPRTDAYSVYTDAFYNSQQRASSGAATAQAVSGLWRNPNRIHIYGGVDALIYRRSKPTNRPLVTVTENLFYRDPIDGQFNSRMINADYPTGSNATFGFDPYPGIDISGNATRINQLYSPPTSPSSVANSGPNTPGYYIRVKVGTGASNDYYTPTQMNPNPKQNVFTPVNQTIVSEAATVVSQPLLRGSPQDGILLPGQPLMETNDFDNGQRIGVRPKIGLEFENGDRLEFSYMWFNDFKAPTLIKDVSGSAFLMHQLYDLGTGDGTLTAGPYYYYQRFGYLTSPFRMQMNTNSLTNASWQFAGERRLALGIIPSAAFSSTANTILPNSPYKEVPEPVVNQIGVAGATFPTTPTGAAAPPPTATNTGGPTGAGPSAAPLQGTNVANGIRSGSVPREPTVDDVRLGAALIAPDPSRYNQSFLWMDGEFAVANYSFDLQGAELMYKHVYSPDWVINGWQLNLVGGVRHVNMNESLGFFFADIAGHDTAALSGQNAQYPFDRAIANPNPLQPISFGPAIPGNQIAAGVSVAPQPSNQTYALYTNTVRNTLLSPEVGAEANFPFWSYFEFNVAGRGGFAANFLKGRYTLVRGDGAQYMDYSKSIVGSGGIIEGLLGATFRPLPNIAIRGGFEYLLLMNVGTGISNINFNLPQVDQYGTVINGRRPTHNESVLFTGWSGGVEIVY